MIDKLANELIALVHAHGGFAFEVAWDDDVQMWGAWSIGFEDGERDMLGAGVTEAAAYVDAIKQVREWLAAA